MDPGGLPQRSTHCPPKSIRSSITLIVVDVPNIPSILTSLHDVGRRGIELKRFKGLGEISPKEFKQFICDDQHLEQVRVGSMGEVKVALDFYMGKNTPQRKAFIIENLIADIS